MLQPINTALSSRVTVLFGRGSVAWLALGLVWVTMATSGLVFSEPCPTDLGTLALAVLLPAIGLVRIGPTLGLFILAWAIAAVFGLLSAFAASELTPAIMHTVVSLFLYAGMIVMAGFIAYAPRPHLTLVFNGLVVAAVIAAATGIGGYFGVIPGAEMFTKFDRASGTFKDPNVFGPFLVAPLLYVLHQALNRHLSRSAHLWAIVALLALGVLLSFSRGAWLNLLAGVAIYLVLALATAPTTAQVRKIMLLSAFSVALLGGTVTAALQFEKVSSLLAERASMTQSYDVGPEGRFGGQDKAMHLILDNPLGIGAQQFASAYHHEEVHNVYLSMLLNAGWVGGTVYAILTVLTIVVGLRAARHANPAQPFVMIAVAAFIANALEGFIIDTDHWRHVYLLMAIIWGAATASYVAHSDEIPGERDQIRKPMRFPASSRAPRLVLAS